MLACCLAKLRGAHEIIVTDDSSDSSTKELVEKEFPYVRWIPGPRRGPAANRNHGARAATGNWLAFIDDDCEPQPGWLEAISAHCWADVVEGQTICPSNRDDPFEEQVENLNGDNFWSCNLAMRRSAFFELGGFDEDFLDAAGEDMELAWRIRRSDLRTVFTPAAQVIHRARRISWRMLLWRTWLLRWRLLYRLKTGDDLSPNAGALRIGSALVGRETTELMRLIVHLFTRRDAKRPRSQLFHTVRRMVTFPIVLPYLLVWEFRFRKQLTERARPASQQF
jgi:GT2 family glycosyltransferase